MSRPDDELRALLDEGRELHAPSHDERAGPATSRQFRRELDEEPEEPVFRGATGAKGRPTSALQSVWIDSEDVPFTPVVRPGRVLPARLFSIFVLGAVMAFLAWMIVPEVSFRLQNLDKVTVRDGVLTAQPVPLASTVPGTVESLWLDPADPPDTLLEKSTLLARIRREGVDVSGSSTVEIVMPFDGREASVDALNGAVTLPQSPVATVYDPYHMYVVVTVRASVLRRLKHGMKATLSTTLVGSDIPGTVVSAVPALGDSTEPADRATVNVRIRPDSDRVSDLVPGLRFHAVIDLGSAPDGARPLAVNPRVEPGE